MVEHGTESTHTPPPRGLHCVGCCWSVFCVCCIQHCTDGMGCSFASQFKKEGYRVVLDLLCYLLCLLIIYFIFYLSPSLPCLLLVPFILYPHSSHPRRSSFLAYVLVCCKPPSRPFVPPFPPSSIQSFLCFVSRFSLLAPRPPVLQPSG